MAGRASGRILPTALGLLALLGAAGASGVHDYLFDHYSVEVVTHVRSGGGGGGDPQPLGNCFPAARTVNVDGFRSGGACATDCGESRSHVPERLVNPVLDVRYSPEVDVGKVVQCLQNYPKGECQVNPGGSPDDEGESVRFVFVEPAASPSSALFADADAYYPQDCGANTTDSWADVVTSAPSPGREVAVDCSRASGTQKDHEVDIQFVLPWSFEGVCGDDRSFVRVHTDPEDPLRVVDGRLHGYIEFAASAIIQESDVFFMTYFAGNQHNDWSGTRGLTLHQLEHHLKTMDFSDFADTHIEMTFALHHPERPQNEWATVRAKVPVEQPLVVAILKEDEPLYIEDGELMGYLKLAGAVNTMDQTLSALFVRYDSHLDPSQTNRFFDGMTLAMYERELRKMRFQGFNGSEVRLNYVMGDDPATQIRLKVVPDVVRVETAPEAPLRVRRGIPEGSMTLDGYLRFVPFNTSDGDAKYTLSVKSNALPTYAKVVAADGSEALTLPELEAAFLQNSPVSFDAETFTLLFTRVRDGVTAEASFTIPFVTIATPKGPLRLVHDDEQGEVKLDGVAQLVPHITLDGEEEVQIVVKYVGDEMVTQYLGVPPAPLVELGMALQSLNLRGIQSDRVEVMFIQGDAIAREVLILGDAPFVHVETRMAEPLRVERGRLTGYLRFVPSDAARVGASEPLSLRVGYEGLNEPWIAMNGLALGELEARVRALSFEKFMGSELLLTFLRGDGTSAVCQLLTVYPPAPFLIVETLAWQPLRVADGKLKGFLRINLSPRLTDDQEAFRLSITCQTAGISPLRKVGTFPWTPFPSLEATVLDADVAGCERSMTLRFERRDGSVMQKTLVLHDIDRDTVVEPVDTEYIQIDVLRLGAHHNSLDICYPSHQSVGVDGFMSACTDGEVPACRENVLIKGRLGFTRDEFVEEEEEGVPVAQIGRCLEHHPISKCEAPLGDTGSVRLLFIADTNDWHHSHPKPLFENYAEVDCDAAGGPDGATLPMRDSTFGANDNPGIQECEIAEPRPPVEVQIVIPWNFDYCAHNWVRVHYDDAEPLTLNGGRLMGYMAFAGAAALLDREEVRLQISYTTQNGYSTHYIVLSGKTIDELEAAAKGVMYEGFHGDVLTLKFMCHHHEPVEVYLPVNAGANEPAIVVRTKLEEPLHVVQQKLQGFIGVDGKDADAAAGVYTLTVGLGENTFVIADKAVADVPEVIASLEFTKAFTAEDMLMLTFAESADTARAVAVALRVYALSELVAVRVNSDDPLVMSAAGRLSGTLLFTAGIQVPPGEELTLRVSFTTTTAASEVTLTGTVEELQLQVLGVPFLGFSGKAITLTFISVRGGSAVHIVSVQQAATDFIAVETKPEDPLLLSADGSLLGYIAFKPVGGFDTATPLVLRVTFNEINTDKLRTVTVADITVANAEGGLRGVDFSKMSGSTLLLTFLTPDGAETQLEVKIRPPLPPDTSEHRLVFAVARPGDVDIATCYPAAHAVGVDNWGAEPCEPHECAGAPLVKSPLQDADAFMLPSTIGEIDVRALAMCMEHHPAFMCVAPLRDLKHEVSTRVLFVNVERDAPGMVFADHTQPTCSGSERLEFAETTERMRATSLRLACDAFDGSHAAARVDLQVVVPWRVGMCGENFVRVHVDPQRPLAINGGKLVGYVQFAGAVDVLGEDVSLTVTFITQAGVPATQTASGDLMAVEEMFKAMNFAGVAASVLDLSFEHLPSRGETLPRRVQLQLPVARSAFVEVFTKLEEPLSVGRDGHLQGFLEFGGAAAAYGPSELQLTVSFGETKIIFKDLTLKRLEAALKVMDLSKLKTDTVTLLFTTRTLALFPVEVALSVRPPQERLPYLTVMTDPRDPLKVNEDGSIAGHIAFFPSADLAVGEVLDLTVTYQTILFVKSVEIEGKTLPDLEDAFMALRLRDFGGRELVLKFTRGNGQKLEARVSVKKLAKFLLVETDANDPLIAVDGKLSGALKILPVFGMSPAEPIAAYISYTGGPADSNDGGVDRPLNELADLILNRPYPGIRSGTLRLKFVRTSNKEAMSFELKVFSRDGVDAVYKDAISVAATTVGFSSLSSCFPAAHTVGVDEFVPCATDARCARTMHIHEPLAEPSKPANPTDVDVAWFVWCVEHHAVGACQYAFPEAVSMRVLIVKEDVGAHVFRGHANPTCDGTQQLPFQRYRDQDEVHVGRCWGSHADYTELQLVVASPLDTCGDNFVRVHTHEARPLIIHNAVDGTDGAMSGYVAFHGAWYLFEDEDILSMSIAYDTNTADVRATFTGTLSELEAAFLMFHYKGFVGGHVYLSFTLKDVGTIRTTLAVMADTLEAFVRVSVDPDAPLVVDRTKRLSGSLELSGRAADFARGELTMTVIYKDSSGELVKQAVTDMVLEEMEDYLFSQSFQGLNARTGMCLLFTTKDGRKVKDDLILLEPEPLVRVSVDNREPLVWSAGAASAPLVQGKVRFVPVDASETAADTFTLRVDYAGIEDRDGVVGEGILEDLEAAFLAFAFEGYSAGPLLLTFVREDGSGAMAMAKVTVYAPETVGAKFDEKISVTTKRMMASRQEIGVTDQTLAQCLPAQRQIGVDNFLEAAWCSDAPPACASGPPLVRSPLENPMLKADMTKGIPVEAIGECLQHLSTAECALTLSEPQSIQIVFAYRFTDGSAGLVTPDRNLWRHTFNPTCDADTPQPQRISWKDRNTAGEPRVADCVGNEGWPVDLQLVVPWAFNHCGENFVRVHTDPKAAPLSIHNARLRGYIRFAGADVYGKHHLSLEVRYKTSEGLVWHTLRGGVGHVEKQFQEMRFEGYQDARVTLNFAMWNVGGLSIEVPVEAVAASKATLKVSVIPEAPEGAAESSEFASCVAAGRVVGVDAMAECTDDICNRDPVVPVELVNPLDTAEIAQLSPWAAMGMCLEHMQPEECLSRNPFDAAAIDSSTQVVFIKPVSRDTAVAWTDNDAGCMPLKGKLSDLVDATATPRLAAVCDATPGSTDIAVAVAFHFNTCHSNFVRVHVNPLLPLIVQNGVLRGYFRLAATWVHTPQLKMTISLSDKATFTVTGDRNRLQEFFMSVDWNAYDDASFEGSVKLDFERPASPVLGAEATLTVYLPIEREKLVPVQKLFTEVVVLHAGSEPLSACYPAENSVGVDNFAPCEGHVCASETVIDARLESPFGDREATGDVAVRAQAECLEHLPARECEQALPYGASLRFVYLAPSAEGGLYEDHATPSCVDGERLALGDLDKTKQPGIQTCSLDVRMPAENQMVIAWPFTTCGENWIRVHVDRENAPLVVDNGKLSGYIALAAAYELIPEITMRVTLNPSKTEVLTGSIKNVLARFQTELDWSQYETVDETCRVRFETAATLPLGRAAKLLDVRVPVAIKRDVPEGKQYVETSVSLPGLGSFTECYPTLDQRGLTVLEPCADAPPAACATAGPVVRAPLANPTAGVLADGAAAGVIARVLAECLENFAVDECQLRLRTPASVRYVFIPMHAEQDLVVDYEAACDAAADMPWSALPSVAPPSQTAPCAGAARDQVATQVLVAYDFDVCGANWVRVHTDPTKPLRVFEGMVDGYLNLAASAVVQGKIHMTVRLNARNSVKLVGTVAKILEGFRALDFSVFRPLTNESEASSVMKLSFAAEEDVSAMFGLRPFEVNVPVEVTKPPSRVLLDVVMEGYQIPGTTLLESLTQCYAADLTYSESTGYTNADDDGTCPTPVCAQMAHVPAPLKNYLDNAPPSDVMDLDAITRCVENFPLRECQVNVTNLPEAGLRLIMVKPSATSSSWTFEHSRCSDKMALNWAALAAGDEVDGWPLLDHEINIGCLHEWEKVGTQLILPWNFTSCGANWVRVHTDPEDPLTVDPSGKLAGYLRFAAAEALFIHKDTFGQVRPQFTVTVSHAEVQDWDFGTFRGDLNGMREQVLSHTYANFAGGEVVFTFVAMGYDPLSVVIPIAKAATPVPETPAPTRPRAESNETYLLLAKLDALPAPEWVDELLSNTVNFMARLFDEKDAASDVLGATVEVACLVKTSMYSAGISNAMRNSDACRRYDRRVVLEQQALECNGDCSVLVEMKVVLLSDGSAFARSMLAEGVAEAVQSEELRRLGVRTSLPPPTLVDVDLNIEATPRAAELASQLAGELETHLPAAIPLGVPLRAAVTDVDVLYICPFIAEGYDPGATAASQACYAYGTTPGDATAEYSLFYTRFRVPDSERDIVRLVLQELIAKDAKLKEFGVVRVFETDEQGITPPATPAPPATPPPTPTPVGATDAPRSVPVTTDAPDITGVDEEDTSSKLGWIIVVVVGVLVFCAAGIFMAMRCRGKNDSGAAGGAGGGAAAGGDARDKPDREGPNRHDQLYTDPNYSDAEMDETEGPQAVRVDIATTDVLPPLGGSQPQSRPLPAGGQPVSPPAQQQQQQQDELAAIQQEMQQQAQANAAAASSPQGASAGGGSGGSPAQGSPAHDASQRVEQS